MPRAKSKSNSLTAVLESVTSEAIKELPIEMKTELNSLSGETNEKLMENVEQSWIQAAEEIVRIDERADFAIQVVTQSIRTQAAVAKGQVILSIQDKYGHLPGFETSYTAFAERIGTTLQHVHRWVAAARSVEEHSNVFGNEFMMSLAPKVLSEMHTLPSSIQTAMLEDAKDGDRKITTTEVMDIKGSTAVKLISATEKLEEKQEIVDAATELMAEAKELGATTKNDSEYAALYSQAKSASAAIEQLNKRIAELKADLVGEKAKAESAQKAQESLEKEMQELKWDDETVREQRVKRIQSTLTVGIPNTLADLMRFVTEEDHYQGTYKTAIREQMISLKTFLEEHA